MKYISLVLVVATFGFACSSEPANKPVNSSTNKPSAATPANPASPAAAPPATVSSIIPTTPIVSNGKDPLPEVEGTLVPAPPTDPTNAQGNPMGRKGKQLVDHPATGPTPPPRAVPAGENSVITVTMDKYGRFVETRVFKDHPDLVKAERVLIDASSSVLTLTLRNGKQIRASGAGIPSFAAATAVDLMTAVGIKISGTDPSSTGARQ